MFLLSGISTLLGGGGTAAGTAVAAAPAAASTGISISSILQGVATVGGLVASISAGNAEAEKLNAEAVDAEREKTFEVVQSADRKRSLLKAAQEAVGDLDTAYAASGVDLSFGTARQARSEIFRETDLGLDSDSATTSMRLDRLTERASNYRKMAKRAKKMGLINGIVPALSGFASLSQQY